MDKKIQTQYFLARFGQSTGPYGESDIEALRRSGELLNYSWIWKVGDTEWKALDPAPAKLPITHHEPAHALRSIPTQAPAQAPVHHVPQARHLTLGDMSRFEALCHDRHHIIQGAISDVYELGCRLVGIDRKGSPELATESHLVLNLLNSATGESFNIPVKMERVQRENGVWNYHLRWQSVPEILLAS